jgi:hypothetical protein
MAGCYQAAEFRRRAEQRLELARQISLHDHRDRLIEMANKLLALARKEEGKPER